MAKWVGRYLVPNTYHKLIQRPNVFMRTDRQTGSVSTATKSYELAAFGRRQIGMVLTLLYLQSLVFYLVRERLKVEPV